MARDSSGNTAASVFPPAVGARTRMSRPSRTGPIHRSWTGRRDRQPSEFTTWCWSEGWSRSKSLTGGLAASLTVSELQVDVVHPAGGVPLGRRHLVVRQGQLVVLGRVEVRVLVDPVQHVAD